MTDRSIGTLALWAVAAVLGVLALMRIVDHGGEAATPVRIAGDRGGASGAAALPPAGPRAYWCMWPERFSAPVSSTSPRAPGWPLR